jgi:hypothetical protein
VAELIDPTTGYWDEDLVKGIFLHADAIQILAIPLREGMDDFYAWFYEPKGVFTVKSTYKLHRQLLQINGSNYLGEPSVDAYGFKWYDIWICPCPPSIKTFLWCIAYNSLPVNWSIQRRGLEVDPICPVCKRFNEDGGHLFLRCKDIRLLWRDLGLNELRLKLLDCVDPKHVLAELLHQDTKTKLKCVALLWTWWKTRNKTNAEGGTRNLGQIKAQIYRLAAEYEDAFVKHATQAALPKPRWKPPEGDALKINTDGCFDPNSRSGG